MAAKRFLSVVVVALILVGTLGVDESMAAACYGLGCHEPDDSTAVVIAEDKTSETDCVAWINAPTNQVACDPGSVIIPRKTTYAEVRQRGIEQYVVLTGNEKVDQAQERQLVAQVHRAIVMKSGHADPMAPRFTIQACTPATYRLGSSYLTIPSDPNSIRIYYEFEYTVNMACGATNIKDRDKSDGRLGAEWNWTCTDSTSIACDDRGISLTGTYTLWQAARDSSVGKYYQNIAAPPCWNCGRPYGVRQIIG